jgi:tetratricopeptide (TPR) repeat protein
MFPRFLLFFFLSPFLFAQNYLPQNCAADTALAHTLFRVGEKLRKASKLDSAALCYEQAAAIWEKACPEAKGEERKRFWEEYLKNKNRRGFLFYLQGGANASAITYLLNALQQALPHLGENPANEEISYIHSNLGVFYSSQKRYTEALTHFQKALAIQRATQGENSARVATNYNNIANAYEEQQRYQEALQYHQKALAIRIAVYGENHINVGTTHNNIGNVYGQQERYPEALEHHQKALAIRIAAYGENHPEVAMSYNNIYSIYKKQKRYAEALECQQKALAIWLNAYGANHPNVVLSYNNISELYYRQNNYAEALAYCQKALESNAPNWKPSKKFELPQSSSILNTDYLLNTLIVLSQTLFSVGISSKTTAGRDSALSYALKATHYGIGQLNGWRQTMRRETDQIELGKQATRLLSTGIACAFLMDSLGFQEQAPLKEAFFFSESNKAAALNLAMQESEALVAAGIPESLNALQQDYKRELTLCNQQLEAMPIPKTKEDTIKKQYYENRRFTYAAKFDSLIHALEKQYPKYYELKYATFVAGVDTLQKTLFARSPNTAI